MFGIGLPELILILVVALVIIGPKKLPDVAKALGRAAGEFRRATSDFKDAIDLDDDLRELKNVKDSISDLKDGVRSKISFDDITKGLSSTGNADDKNTTETPETSDDMIDDDAVPDGAKLPDSDAVPDGAKLPDSDTAKDPPPVDQKEPDPNARG